MTLFKSILKVLGLTRLMPAPRRREIRARFRGHISDVQRFLKTHPIEPQDVDLDGNAQTVTFLAYLDEVQLRAANEAGLVEIVMFPLVAGRNPQDDVSKINRFANGLLPRGAGRNQNSNGAEEYYNVVEADCALQILSVEYSDFAELLTLDQRSEKGKCLYALHLRKKPDPKDRKVIMLLGCLHGDEWGSCEILIQFAAGLLDCCKNGGDLNYGGQMQVAEADAKQVLEHHDIVIFPVVNRDGREHSQTDKLGIDAQIGRKNARGVDINRNFGVMFPHEDFLVPGLGAAVDICPKKSLFRGEGPFSERETCNVRSLLDKFARTRWLVDLHSAGNSINYGWGCDDMQTTDEEQSFATSNQKVWGVPGDSNKEYVHPGALTSMKTMAKTFRDCKNKVWDTQFKAALAFPGWPTPGTSHDYAFSRQILSFYVEWGFDDGKQPTLTKMQKTVEAVSAGLMGFCTKAY